MEVDFALYGPRGPLAFEVKRSARYTRADLSGLRSFKKDYPMARCHLLYGGEHSRQEGDVLVLPTHQALPQLASVLQPREN